MRKCPILVLILAVFFVCSLATGRERVVTTTADSGPGSLRWALQAARPGDVITFDPVVFPPDNPGIINLQKGLPHLERGKITVDASNAGVVLDGSHIRGGWICGLEIASDNNKIRGLTIRNFPGAGILISGSQNFIGGPGEAGNVLCGNSDGIGLFGAETRFNVVQGNYIGVTPHDDPCGNTYAGIFVEEGASDNTIGPNNVIAFNGCGGVEIRGVSCRRNIVTGNSICHNGGAAILAPFPEPPGLVSMNPDLGEVSGFGCPNCMLQIFSDDGEEACYFEGETQADNQGNFHFVKGKAFVAANVRALVIDPEVGTSALASLRPGAKWAPLQEENPLPQRGFRTLPSGELDDNRIGSQWDILGFSMDEAEGFLYSVSQVGLKWARVILDHGDWVDVNWSAGEHTRFYIEPVQKRIIAGLAQQGITVMCCLVFWDKEARGKVEEPGYSRFEDEAEVQRYLNYVGFVVRELKGYVKYYEILNEPNCWEGTQQYVRMPTYLRLARRVGPVIHKIDPDAKIVVGAIAAVQKWGKKDLLQLVNSGTISLADGISFHPMYGVSPEHQKWRQYYYDYPTLLDLVRSRAERNGFSGVLIADELTWLGHDESDPKDPDAVSYSDLKAAKYLARGVVLHLGKGFVAMAGMLGALGPHEWSPKVRTLHVLCTAMAGHEAIDMPVKVDINYEGPVAYCSFRYPNGDRMLAIWTDGIAQDEDPGVPATIRFPGLMATTVTGIDVLHGFQQELEFKIEDDATVVRDVLVKDYPILIRLSGLTLGPGYRERVGDGFHRLGMQRPS